MFGRLIHGDQTPPLHQLITFSNPPLTPLLDYTSWLWMGVMENKVEINEKIFNKTVSYEIV